MRDKQLWQRVQAFQLDDDTSTFPFSHRLARDNRWSIDYANRVILEYKKFIYLCCVGYGEITPSDAVDQAWHLHLTYTKSYWIDLCKNTLLREVHHNPTKGGTIEREKYSDCYNKTFSSYAKEFDEQPPKDIWLDNRTRFSQINYQRINISQFWLIQKPSLNYYGLSVILASLLLIGLFIQSDNSVPWFALFICFVFFILIVKNIRNGGKGGRGKRGGGGGSFWGCSGGDSGCGGHGCSGCGGCGGGD